MKFIEFVCEWNHIPYFEKKKLFENVGKYYLKLWKLEFYT